MSRTIAIVPARAGSRGIPNKCSRELAGHPLVNWTLVAALQACDLVVLTSNDPEVLALGWCHERLRVHPRSVMLATARTPDLPVVMDAYRQIDQAPDDVIILLRPTAPFRRAGEIRQVAEILQCDRRFDSVRSVVPAQEHPAKMYLEAGFARGRDDIARHPLLAPAMGSAHRANHPRQWLPPAWRACGFIDAVRADVLVGLDTLEGDLIVGWPAPIGRASIELDREEQFLWAEAMAQEQGWKPGLGS